MSETSEKPLTLTEIVSKYNLNEGKFVEENPDLILISGGNQFVYESKYLDDFPKNAKSMQSSDGQALKKKHSGPGKIWECNSLPRLDNGIKRKEEKVKRLQREISELEHCLGKEQDQRRKEQIQFRISKTMKAKTTVEDDIAKCIKRRNELLPVTGSESTDE